MEIPDFQKLDKWEDINKTDGHDITEILFKVEFTINQTTVVNRILSVNKIYYIRKWVPSIEGNRFSYGDTDDLLKYVPSNLDKYGLDKDLQHIDNFIFCVTPLLLVVSCLVK